MRNDECVISFANSRGNYYKGLERLRQSMNEFWPGRFIGFTDEWSVGAPLHTDNPYAFKVYCFRRALAEGYRRILYVDSSVWAVRNIQPVFDIIDADGYIMQEAGAYLRDWTNENALNYFGINRKDFGDKVMYGNAGMLGLDFDNPLAADFFREWEKSMEAGIFKGSWADHRHDMTCGSIIANHLGMKFQSGNEILEYAHWDAPIKNDTIVFKAAGL